MVKDFSGGETIAALIEEFNEGETVEAKLARDADQLSLILDLKNLADIGYRTPNTWIPHVLDRLTTDTGKKMAERILESHRDDWWLEKFR